MKRKIVSVILSCLLLCGVCSSLTACGKKHGDNYFTWWAVTGEPLFYRDYEDNPVVEYVMKNVQFKSKDGSMKNIELDFSIPATSEAARNDFTNKINSRNFEDIMDPTMYTGSVAELYENGVILDLTKYVTDAEIMPNLAKYISDNPDMAIYLQTTLSNGSKAYLTIPGLSDSIVYTMQAFGYNYRRDWLIKYGKHPTQYFDPMKDAEPTANPKAGQDFSGRFTKNLDGTDRNDAMTKSTALPAGADGDSWEDDLLFPSGNKHPVYISDWQWMFGIFQTALSQEGINDDAYVMSLFYPGYNANGDLVSGFGGGGPLVYKDKNNNAQFGATSQGFRAYLECMNDWYKKGWIDKYFNEKTEPFYQTDNERVAAGKVPVWMGNSSRLGTRLVNGGSGYEKTAGALVYGAATPINDIPAYDGNPSTNNYSVQATAAQAATAMAGGEGSAYMLQTPTCMFQNERLGGGVVISKSAEKKDLQLLLSFFDYFYGEEGARLRTIGLSKEQYETTNNKTYTDNGLTNGSYTETEGGKLLVDPVIVGNSTNLESAAKCERVVPGLAMYSKLDYGYSDTYAESRGQWVKYEATGFIGGMINGQLTPADTKMIGDVAQPLEQNYLYKNVYKFIKGETSLDNSSWSGFCSSVMNYRNKGKTIQDAINAYQTTFDKLYRS